MIEPTPNDVLSGRGASFNRHPGNENFRRMLEQHREVYSQSVKVRKVAITKSIVEAIYSMEPPGRFLRKCATTGEWEELSKKEADNKAAQAMAYAVRDLTKRGPSRVPSQIHLSRNDQESETTTDRETTDNSTSPSLQLQRLLPSLQQSRSVNILPDQNQTNYTAQAAASLIGLAQSLNRGQQQLILQQQQQQSLLSLLGQRSLQPQTQHASASVPLNPPLSAHLQRALLDDILRHQLLSSLTQQQQQQQSLLSLLGQRSLQPQTQHASAPVPLNPSSSAHLQRALLDDILRQSLLTAQLPDTQSITNRQQDLLSQTTREIPQNQAEMSPRQQTIVNQLQHRLDALLQDQLLSSLQENQWLLQYPSRPFDLLRQAWQGSQNDANLHPHLSRTSTSSPPTRQQGGAEDEEKQDERK